VKRTVLIKFRGQVAMDLGSGKFNLRLKAKILISCKLQAPSLTVTE